MSVGQYTVKVDGGGAFAIPADWRPFFAESDVMIAPTSSCSELMLSPTTLHSPSAEHELPYGTIVVHIDNWRVTLPKEFLRNAGIEERMILCGALRYVKIRKARKD